MRTLFRKTETILFLFLTLFLPTQLGKHFWPDFSIIQGIRVDYLSPTLYLTDLFVLSLFLAWAARGLRENTSAKSKIKNQKYFLFFVAFLLTGILLNGNVLNGIYHLLKFFEFSFVGHYVATTIKSSKQLGWITTIFAVAVIGESLLAFAHFVHQGSIGGLLYFFGERTFTSQTPGIANASINGELILRPYGTFPHPNVLAGYLVVSMLLISSNLFLKVKKIRIWFSALAMLLGIVALMATMSRVAILLWIVILAGYMLLKMSKRDTSLLLTILLVSITTFLLFSPLSSRFTQTTLSDETIAQREQLNHAALRMIAHSPFLGVGLGNFLPTLATMQKPFSVGMYLQPAHNTYLFVAAETGIVGVGIFFWFLFKTFKRLLVSFRKKKTERGFAAILLLSLFSIILLGFFDHYWVTLQQGQLLFAYIAGLCWSKIKH